MMGQSQFAIQALNKDLYYGTVPESARATKLLGSLIFIYLISGNLDMTAQVNRKLLNFLKMNNSEYTEAWAFYMEGLTHLGLGNLETALENFTKVKDKRFIVYTRAAVDSLALLYQMIQQTEKASETVKFLQAFALETDDPAYITIARSCAARLAVLQGDTEVIRRWLQTADLSTDKGFMFFWWEVPRITECRALIAVGTTDYLAQASEKLDHYSRENRTTHNTLRMIEILILQTMINLKRRQDTEALAALEQALTLAMLGGWIFPFLESGQALIPPLKTLRSKNIFPHYIGRILDAFSQRYAHISTQKQLKTPAATLEEALTYREREVLALLAQEMSNQEIAGELTNSPHTVKRHTSALYRKLDVKNRRQAVVEARQVGLLTAE